MDYHPLQALILLSQIGTTFTVFTVLVASIRVTLGHELSAFQLLLVHFFTEGGMLVITFAVMPIILYQFWPDEVLVAKYCSWYTLGAIFFYLINYLNRRRKVDAPSPITSMLNILGWAILVVILILTNLNIFWSPSLAMLGAVTFWGFFSTGIIFISFLSTFLDRSDLGEVVLEAKTVTTKRVKVDSSNL